MERGWPCQQFAPVAPGGDVRMTESSCSQPPTQMHQQQQQQQQQQLEQQELTELASRALRVLLGSESGLLYPHLRQSVLGSSAASGTESSSRSKCLLELAVASLVDQGLVLRQGYGPFASLLVPHAALSKAEALAYSDFPDEGQLPASFYGGRGQHHLQQPHRHHRAAPCLNRLRRHPSPRQFGSRMSGIEKASGRRSKRSVGDDISNQLQKKMRMHEGIGGSIGGTIGGGMTGDSSTFGAPYSPGGRQAMSP